MVIQKCIVVFVFFIVFFFLCKHVCVVASVISVSETLWTVACYVPLSIEFCRQKYWSRFLCPPPGDLPNPGIETRSPTSPALKADSLPLSNQGSLSLSLALLKPRDFPRAGKKECTCMYTPKHIILGGLMHAFNEYQFMNTKHFSGC